MSLKKFIFYYILYTVLLGGIALLLPHLFPMAEILAQKFWLIFGFMSGLTFVACLLAFTGIKRNPQTGIQAIMGAITIKLLFSMAFVLIYSLNQPERGFVFVINFFSIYLLFTLFEIYALLRNLRDQNKK